MHRQLLISFISLSIGALIVIAGIIIIEPYITLHASKDRAETNKPTLYKSSSFKLVIGDSKSTSEGRQLDYSAEGRVLLARKTHFYAESFDYIRVELANGSTQIFPYFFWRKSTDPENIHRRLIPIGTGNHFMLTMAGTDHWNGPIIELGLDLYTTDLSTNTVFSELSLVPHSAIGFLESIYYKWMSVSQWSGASINSYKASLDLPPINLTPVLAAWCLVSLFISRLAGLKYFTRNAYLHSRSTSGDYTAATYIALSVSLVFSGFWFHQLCYRVNLTHSTYSGLTVEEKKALDFDADVYSFAKNVAEQLREMNPNQVVWLLDGVSAKDRYLHYRLRYYLAFVKMVTRDSSYSIPRVSPGDFVFAVGARPHDSFDPVSKQFTHNKWCFDAVEVSSDGVITMYRALSKGKECTT